MIADTMPSCLCAIKQSGDASMLKNRDAELDRQRGIGGGGRLRACAACGMPFGSRCFDFYARPTTLTSEWDPLRRNFFKVNHRMPNSPLDDETGSFRVLRNDEGQYSLWPDFIEIPAGWFAQHGPDTRAACLAYIEQNWTDMRPYSLVLAMEKEKVPLVE